MKYAMKIIFDIDGTLTDYNAFVRETAIPYFEKQYGWTVVHPDANNYATVKEITMCLKVGGRVGIFPEGTTSREVDKDFNDFDPSFLTAARQTKALIQPITVLWQKKNRKRKRIIINFGPAFTVDNNKKNEALKHFEEIQRIALEENKRVM